MQLTKPAHKRYALYRLDNETYVEYANADSSCKR